MSLLLIKLKCLSLFCYLILFTFHPIGKALSPISVTPFGIVIFVSYMHKPNEPFSVTLFGIIIFLSDEHSQKYFCLYEDFVQTIKYYSTIENDIIRNFVF